MRKDTEPKQIIVVNKALNMPSGKLAAQVAHASLGALFEAFKQTDYTVVKPENPALQKWINERFTKVVVYVKSEEKLLKVFEQAKEKGLPCALIQDAGFTVFDEPTFTCVGIGPAFPEEFIGVTDKLRLL